MNVQNVMSRDVETCGPESDLAEAAMIMWRKDCGVVPVTTGERQVVGVITDRDICMAVATKHRCAEDVQVREVIAGEPVVVRADDDVRTAMERMRTLKIRRMPVVDRNGTLQGVVSLNDLALKAESGSSRADHLAAEDVFAVLRSVCEHGHTSQREPVHA